jgi:hypothetical protein
LKIGVSQIASTPRDLRQSSFCVMPCRSPPKKSRLKTPVERESSSGSFQVWWIVAGTLP